MCRIVGVAYYATRIAKAKRQGRIYVWGGPEKQVPTEEGGSATYKTITHTHATRP